MSRRAFSLVEVLLALVVLSVALVPILVMNSMSRAEVRDSESFAALLVKADETAATDAAGRWPFTQRTAQVGDGPRKLVVHRFAVDPAASCAPPVAEATP